jgi:hypothetical protein
MRRFDQFIRHRDHFGKRSVRVHPNHQIDGDSVPWASSASQAAERSRKKLRNLAMFEVDHTLSSRRFLVLFFALLSGLSAVSTAVLPVLIVHA